MKEKLPKSKCAINRATENHIQTNIHKENDNKSKR